MFSTSGNSTHFTNSIGFSITPDTLGKDQFIIFEIESSITSYRNVIWYTITGTHSNPLTSLEVEWNQSTTEYDVLDTLLKDSYDVAWTFPDAEAIELPTNYSNPEISRKDASDDPSWASFSFNGTFSINNMPCTQATPVGLLIFYDFRKLQIMQFILLLTQFLWMDTLNSLWRWT